MQNRHCAPLTRVPSVAVSVGALKWEQVANLFVEIELARRSAPWGIVFGKDYEGQGGDGGDGGGLPGGGNGGLGGLGGL